MKKLTYLLLALIMVACSDDGENNLNSLEDVFWQVTVGNQTYENSSVSGSGFFSSDCNEVSAFEAYFPDIDTATRFYSADILHNNLTSDFDGTSVGSYPFKGDYLDNDCNLTLSVTLSDYGSPVISNGIHNVTSINQISSSNNETIWSIEGNFSGTYLDNNTQETVSVAGSYRNVIYTYQD